MPHYRLVEQNNNFLKEVISSIRLCAKFLLTELIFMSKNGLCRKDFRTTLTAGKINASPRVCGFPDLAKSNEIL